MANVKKITFFLGGLSGYGAPLPFAAVMFSIMIVGQSFAYAWLRIKSGSLWPAALMHATHNLFVQGVFDGITKPTALTPYMIGEYGVGLALTALVLAYIVWSKRPDRQAAPSTELAASSIASS